MKKPGLTPFSIRSTVCFKIGGITHKPMTWKQHLTALLSINAVWFLLSMFVLTNMAWLPLNPDGNHSMTGDLAFNTSVSFIATHNLQHYSGETGLSYLGQFVLMLWQFISANCAGLPSQRRFLWL
jgi:K+-transporting ATPase ATPase A chain